MGKRDWVAARSKVDREGQCRVGGRVCAPPEAAHIVARARTPPDPLGAEHPDNIIPLCPGHHQSYDRRELDILPYLTTPERVMGVRLMHGDLIGFLERTTGERWGPVAFTG